MKPKLTRRQADVYGFISHRCDRDGVPPTLSEIAREFDLATASGALIHVKELVRKGWLKQTKAGSSRCYIPTARRGIPLVRLGELSDGSIY